MRSAIHERAKTDFPPLAIRDRGRGPEEPPEEECLLPRAHRETADPSNPVLTSSAGATISCSSELMTGASVQGFKNRRVQGETNVHGVCFEIARHARACRTANPLTVWFPINAVEEMSMQELLLVIFSRLPWEGDLGRTRSDSRPKCCCGHHHRFFWRVFHYADPPSFEPSMLSRPLRKFRWTILRLSTLRSTASLRRSVASRANADRDKRPSRCSYSA